MFNEQDLPSEERLCQLLDHLGIKRAHITVTMPPDIDGFVAHYPERITSLTLVVPNRADAALINPIAPRTLVIHGEDGALDRHVIESLKQVSLGEILRLSGYATFAWSDIVADRADDIADGLLAFLHRMEHQHGSGAVSIPAHSGEVAGLIYQVRGSGPPLVLHPIHLAPSQWDSVLDRLSEHFCTIVLSGPHVGMVKRLEVRAGEPGYVANVRRMVDLIGLRPGESVLDIGCGPGTLDRWLAHHTNQQNPIVAIDINPFFLREAAALAQREGLGEVISFRSGNAESLSFADDIFDHSISVTVMEEVDADRMLAEMIRVTRSGGRIASIVRAVDRPWWVSAPISPQLRAKIEAVNVGGVAPNGCADAGLYARFRHAGLRAVTIAPQVAPYSQTGGFLDGLVGTLTATLDPAEQAEWYAAMTRAQADGSFFIAASFHCAVGIKP